jgi:hypothetical protein
MRCIFMYHMPSFMDICDIMATFHHLNIGM